MDKRIRQMENKKGPNIIQHITRIQGGVMCNFNILVQFISSGIADTFNMYIII